MKSNIFCDSQCICKMYIGVSLHNEDNSPDVISNACCLNYKVSVAPTQIQNPGHFSTQLIFSIVNFKLMSK